MTLTARIEGTELVLDASTSTGPEAGQTYSVTLSNDIGSVTTAPFQVDVVENLVPPNAVLDRTTDPILDRAGDYIEVR